MKLWETSIYDDGSYAANSLMMRWKKAFDLRFWNWFFGNRINVLLIFFSSMRQKIFYMLWLEALGKKNLFLWFFDIFGHRTRFPAYQGVDTDFKIFLIFSTTFLNFSKGFKNLIMRKVSTPWPSLVIYNSPR